MRVKTNQRQNGEVVPENDTDHCIVKPCGLTANDTFSPTGSGTLTYWTFDRIFRQSRNDLRPFLQQQARHGENDTFNSVATLRHICRG
uniref:Uncharacterized protein n=1 Tax=Timema tahoe TaxID=61484 RepID=A0A7R9ILP3_9NEOP|nr:unnamed protein product [Timema tahoe]